MHACFVRILEDLLNVEHLVGDGQVVAGPGLFPLWQPLLLMLCLLWLRLPMIHCRLKLRSLRHLQREKPQPLILSTESCWDCAVLLLTVHLFLCQIYKFCFNIRKHTETKQVLVSHPSPLVGDKGRVPYSTMSRRASPLMCPAASTSQ